MTNYLIKRKTRIAILLMSMIVLNGFISVPGLGIICGILALYFADCPQYLLPSLFTASYLDETCFIFGSLTASRYLIIVFLITTFILKCISGSVKFDRNMFLYLGGLLIYLFLSCIFSTSGFTTSFISMALNILFVMMIGSDYVEDVSSIYSILLLGSCEIIIMLFGNYINGAVSFVNGSYELLSSTNNNMVGMLLAQIGALFISYYMIMDNGIMRWKKIICILGVIFTIILLFLSGSRSALFGLCVAIVIAYIYNITIDGRNIGGTVRNMLILLVTIAIGYYFLQSNELLSERFTLQAVTESGGTGRLDIWKCVWNEAFLKHPIFGVGYGGTNIQQILYSNGIHHSGTHNILIDLMATIGLVGTSYVVCGFSWIVRKCVAFVRYCPYMICALTMMLAAIANGVGENIFSERFLWLDIGMIISMVINIKKWGYEDGYKLSRD